MSSKARMKRLENHGQRPNYFIKEIMLKVLIVGDYGVGKTAIIRRYTEGRFSSNYKITIGADFSIKTIAWDSTTQVNIQLWDIAGNDKLGFMSRVYYKYAAAAVVVFDSSRLTTFQSLQKWLKDVREKVSLPDGLPIPIIILANKCDIPDASFSTEALNKTCKQYGVLKWYKTSAKLNLNIDEAIMFLMTIAIASKFKEAQEKNENIVLQDSQTEIKKSHCCEA